jgi:regulation of enolase protein 1 (concanavalin A-like superfamily)
MTKVSISSSLLVLAICFFELSSAQDVMPGRTKVIFQEQFKNSMKAGWSWIRPETNAYKISSKGLLMKSLDGNIWGPQTSGRNFLLRTLPPLEEGMSTEVKVQATPGNGFEQAGLIWYDSDKNYIKLVVELFNGEKIVNMVREENDAPVIFKRGLKDTISKQLAISFKDNKAVLIDKATNREADVDINKVSAKQVDLRLVVWSGMVVGQMKGAEEKQWHTIAKCPSFQGANLKVGLITLMGSKEEARWVEFDRFIIRRMKNN